MNEWFINTILAKTSKNSLNVMNDFEVVYDSLFHTFEFLLLAFASWGPLPISDGLQQDLPYPVVLGVIFLSLLQFF